MKPYFTSKTIFDPKVIKPHQFIQVKKPNGDKINGMVQWVNELSIGYVTSSPLPFADSVTVKNIDEEGWQIFLVNDFNELLNSTNIHSHSMIETVTTDRQLNGWKNLRIQMSKAATIRDYDQVLVDGQSYLKAASIKHTHLLEWTDNVISYINTLKKDTAEGDRTKVGVNITADPCYDYEFVEINNKLFVPLDEAVKQKREVLDNE